MKQNSPLFLLGQNNFGNKIQFLILSFSNLIKNYLTKSLVKVGGIEIGLSKIQKSYDRIEWNRIEHTA